MDTRSYNLKRNIFTALTASMVWMATGCVVPMNDDFDNPDDTVEDDTYEDDDSIFTEEFASQISKAYALPFMSGEKYRANGHAAPSEAWDFNLPSGSDEGEPMVAVANGVVVSINYTCDYNCYGGGCCGGGAGNHVKVDNDADSYYQIFYHLRDVYVVNGQWVEKGQVIGTLGNTGNSSGAHLHFDIQSSGGTSYEPKYEYYTDAGAKTSGYLIENVQYRSYNNGKFEAAKDRNGGTTMVGTNTAVPATRVNYNGFAKYYTGGAYGSCAIYYEALGCSGGDTCPSYNNTNYAWLVRTGFYSYYYSIGGPNSWLGFPTGDEYSIAGGAQQNFRNGYLIFNAANGTITAYAY